MNKVVQLYRLFNLLSLDVVAGAIICALFFASVFAVALSVPSCIALGLTVWIIYTADHLLDVRHLNQQASTVRHRFHQKHFNLLCLALFICFVINSVQVFFISTPVFSGGIVLMLIIGVYFVLQVRLKFLKEFFAAILYTGGVLLAPLSASEKALSISQSIFIIQFFLTALINLLLFSWLDHLQDLQDERQSFTTVFGEGISKLVLYIVFLLHVLLCFLVLGLSPEQYKTELVFILMNSVLFLIAVNRNYFKVDDRYRLLGDAVFLLPLILLPFLCH